MIGHEKKDIEELRREACRFLDAHRKMVLTVLDAHEHPNSSLMLFAADEDMNVYFGTRKSFGKYAAVIKNPNVAIAVVQESVDPLQVVDMQGVAELVPDSELAERLDWFCHKNPAKYYVKDAEDFVMFKIVPNGVRWLDATSGELQITDVTMHNPDAANKSGGAGETGEKGGGSAAPEKQADEHHGTRPLLLQIVGGALLVLVILGMLPVLLAFGALALGFALFATYNRGFNTWMKKELAPGTQPRTWFNWLESFTINIFGKRV